MAPSRSTVERNEKLRKISTLQFNMLYVNYKNNFIAHLPVSRALDKKTYITDPKAFAIVSRRTYNLTFIKKRNSILQLSSEESCHSRYNYVEKVNQSSVSILVFLNRILKVVSNFISPIYDTYFNIEKLINS